MNAEIIKGNVFAARRPWLEFGRHSVLCCSVQYPLPLQMKSDGFYLFLVLSLFNYFINFKKHEIKINLENDIFQNKKIVFFLN